MRRVFIALLAIALGVQAPLSGLSAQPVTQEEGLDNQSAGEEDVAPLTGDAEEQQIPLEDRAAQAAAEEARQKAIEEETRKASEGEPGIFASALRSIFDAISIYLVLALAAACAFLWFRMNKFRKELESVKSASRLKKPDNPSRESNNPFSESDNPFSAAGRDKPATPASATAKPWPPGGTPESPETGSRSPGEDQNDERAKRAQSKPQPDKYEPLIRNPGKTAAADDEGPRLPMPEAQEPAPPPPAPPPSPPAPPPLPSMHVTPEQLQGLIAGATDMVSSEFEEAVTALGKVYDVGISGSEMQLGTGYSPSADEIQLIALQFAEKHYAILPSYTYIRGFSMTGRKLSFNGEAIRSAFELQHDPGSGLKYVRTCIAEETDRMLTVRQQGALSGYSD